MRLWKESLICLLISFAAFADTPQIDSEAVRRVARHIACQCGACKDTAVCPMSMQGCGFCVPAKNKIARMQQAGFSDQAIIDQFKKQYGPDIYRAGPSDLFWLVPYGSLFLGAAAILWFVLRVAKAPVPAVVGDPEYARYKDTIERDMGRFDS
jgi:cytochrome c-type biogenesis protein CcmH/NrfF